MMYQPVCSLATTHVSYAEDSQLQDGLSNGSGFRLPICDNRLPEKRQDLYSYLVAVA